MKNNSILHQFLIQLPDGPVEDIPTLTKLVAADWHLFEDSDLGGMDGSKFWDWHQKKSRCEAPTWKTPRLTFKIERHGAVVLGSDTADLQHWELDFDAMKATLAKIGKRRLTARKNFMAAKEAAGIVQQILDHKETDYLVWCPDGRLKIVMWMLLNETGQQVRSYRHKRLSQELLTQLKAVGWEKVSPATFRKRQPADALPAGM